MKRIKLVYSEPKSKELSEEVGAWEGERAELSIYEVEGGGFVFTFSNCYDNHDMYAKVGQKPYATQQEAYETAIWAKGDETHPSTSWMEDYDIVKSW
jgi:hypothetical protein